MTASQTLSPTAPIALTHEHAWIAESVHRTSQGEVVYVRCTGCAVHRVDLRAASPLPPQALSRPAGPVSGGTTPVSAAPPRRAPLR